MSTLQWVLIGLTLLLVAWMLLKRRGDITSEEARRWVENGALLLDVRTATEYSAGHLPSAKNVPVGELRRKLNEIGAKDRAIVVYCLSGSRSAMAKRVLQSAGFQKIANLGSMSRW